MEKINKLQEYDIIMQDQIQEGIIEEVPPKSIGEVLYYVPHHAVIREEAESTTLRIVYDCSAKGNRDQPSLNNCLETGPSHQSLLFDILLRNRMRYYCITGDIKKAFLQIRINKEDRDALQVFWYENIDSRFIKEYRFTRAIFGAGPSPYILNATIEKHVSAYNAVYPKTVKALLNDTYVDDIQGGGDCIKDLKQGEFALHKWHSNVTSLESISNEIVNNGDGKLPPAPRKNGRILGVPCNKEGDTLRIEFTPCMQVKEPITKGKTLSAINSVYDLLGWASPVSITAKFIFSEICQRNVGWDHLIPEDIQKRWNTWVKTFSKMSFFNCSTLQYNSRLSASLLTWFC